MTFPYQVLHFHITNGKLLSACSHRMCMHTLNQDTPLALPWISRSTFGHPPPGRFVISCPHLFSKNTLQHNQCGMFATSVPSLPLYTTSALLKKLTLNFVAELVILDPRVYEI